MGEHPRLTRRRFVMLTAIGLSLGPWIEIARAQDPEPPLTKSPSPYRGRVVELLTDTPLADALVLFVWPYRGDADEGLPQHTFALRETVTDASGTFVIDAVDIEAIAPPGALAPRMLVWKPGYVSLPREYGSRFGVPVAWLAQRGGVIALKPVSGFEERIQAFNVALMNVEKRQSSTPTRELPLLMRLAREELDFFGRHNAELEKDLRKSP